MSDDYYPGSDDNSLELARYILDHQEGRELPEDRCNMCGNVDETVRKKAMVCMGNVEIVRVCERCAP